jgi:hypothetical protein
LPGLEARACHARKCPSFNPLARRPARLSAGESLPRQHFIRSR